MPVERPDLDALVERIIGDIDSTNPELFASIPETPMNVFATAEAGIVHGLYGRADFLFDMALPLKATGTYLAKWGKFYNIPKNPATAAEPTVRFVATGAGTILAETTARRADGALYQITEETSFLAGNVDVLLVALETGVSGSVTAGQALSWTTSIENLSLSGIVQADAEGEDEESDSDYRIRILERAQRVPQGYSEYDYIAWAKAVSGVGDAFIVPTSGPYVDVRIISNDEGDLNPSPELIAAVQAKFDGLRLVTAIPIVSAPEFSADDVTLDSLTPNTEAIQAAVNASLVAFYRRTAIRQPGTTVYRTQLIAAIQDTPGVVTFDMTVPAADVTHDADEMPTLGVVTLPDLP